MEGFQIVQNFNDGNKNLFVFEWEGKFAVIAPELMAFEGYKDVTSSWRDMKQREKFQFGAEYTTIDGEDLKLFKLNFLNETQDLSLVLGISPKTLYDQYKSAPRLDIIFESGIYGVMQNSGTDHAIKFKTFIRRDVAPSIRENGKFDAVEYQINLIEDEKEKFLRLKLHKSEDMLKFDTSDMGYLVQYNNAKVALESYLNTKVQIEEAVHSINEKFTEKFEKTDKLLESAAQLRIGDMSPEAIGRELNIYTASSGRPHRMIGDTLAMVLGFYQYPDGKLNTKNEYVNIINDNRKGIAQYTPYYTELSLKLMKKYIEENGLPLFYKKYKKGKTKGDFQKAWIDFRERYAGTNYMCINVTEDTLNRYIEYATLEE